VQWAALDIFGKPPIRFEQDGLAARFSLSLTITLSSVAIPQILPSMSQIILKIFIWPMDIRNFSGKCTFKLAFPGYPYKHQQPMSNQVANQDHSLNIANNIEHSAHHIEGLSPSQLNQIENIIGLQQQQIDEERQHRNSIESALREQQRRQR
jgi:hypothetical protein